MCVCVCGAGGLFKMFNQFKKSCMWKPLTRWIKNGTTKAMVKERGGRRSEYPPQPIMISIITLTTLTDIK